MGTHIRILSKFAPNAKWITDFDMEYGDGMIYRIEIEKGEKET